MTHCSTPSYTQQAPPPNPLLYVRYICNLYQLCPTTKPYNRQSPTKQYIVCAGRSARAVISSVIKEKQSNSLSNNEENEPLQPKATKENHLIPTPYVGHNIWLRKSTIKSLATSLHSPHAPQFLSITWIVGTVFFRKWLFYSSVPSSNNYGDCTVLLNKW